MLKSLLRLLFPKPRRPQKRAIAAALSGAVIIQTEDGHNVILEPQTAEDLSASLTRLAGKAKKHEAKTTR